MENEQTAVDWLVERLARKHNEFQALTFYYDHKEEIEQAKAMEKEQIMDAYMDSYGNTTEPEDYYNQTYGKEN